MPKCLIVDRDPELWTEKIISTVGLGLEETVVTGNETEIKKHLPDTEIIFGVPTLVAPHLHLAKNLAWFQSSFAGVDALTATPKRDYILTNVKDTYGKLMAEYVFTYILGLKRKIFDNRAWQQSKEWNQFGYASIETETIGIAGTGSIGTEIARISKAFGMRTVGLSRSGRDAQHFDKVHSTANHDSFCSEQLDYVVSVLPATAETLNLFNYKMFSKMISKPVFISIGRGENVEEEELVKALDEGLLSSAILDVFKQEPLPTTSPLWDQERILITPHVSGYFTDIQPTANIAKENLKRYRNQEPLLHQVDFDKGY